MRPLFYRAQIPLFVVIITDANKGLFSTKLSFRSIDAVRYSMLVCVHLVVTLKIDTLYDIII